MGSFSVLRQSSNFLPGPVVQYLAVASFSRVKIGAVFSNWLLPLDRAACTILLLINNSSGPLAQRLEQRTHNPLVGGSNPSGPISRRAINGISLAREGSEGSANDPYSKRKDEEPFPPLRETVLM